MSPLFLNTGNTFAVYIFDGNLFCVMIWLMMKVKELANTGELNLTIFGEILSKLSALASLICCSSLRTVSIITVVKLNCL